MARTNDIIQENLQILSELEEEHDGTPNARKVRMLRLLKEQPALSFGEISEMIGCSERSLQRWWGTYQRGGVASLIPRDGRKPGKPRRIDDSAVMALRRRLQQNGFPDMEEARKWLQDQFGVNYSRSGVWNLLRTTANATPRGWHLLDDRGPAPRDPAPTGHAAPSTTGVSNQVLHFLNALPTSSDVREWGMKFREALGGLLGDVDRVSVNVNLDCDLIAPETYNPTRAITQRIADEHARDPAVVVERTTASPWEGLLENIRQQGFPMDEYHPPLAFDYYYMQKAYVGTIILWRGINREPISATSRNLMKALESFLVFALSDLVARRQADRPIDRVFHDALAYLVDEANLSAQEERIVILQLMGHSYKDMADVLSVTVDTIKKHFKQIHRKTGTRGQAELFAKYFTSRLIPESFKDIGRDSA